nr:MAG: replication associated protein [Cressdnaviricota sp.]
MNYQFRGKRFFLTYSRCELDQETIKNHLLERFQSELKNVEKYVVCQEEHKDGGKHSHCFIELADEFRAKKPSNWLDIQGHHPNIENVRSYKKCLNYIVKDGKYIANFNVKVPNITKKELGLKLIQGEDLITLVEKHPELLIGYKRIKEDVSIYRQDKEKPQPLDKPCGVWIAGPSGVGKSTIATTKFGDYYFKDPSKWWDGYNGESTVICEDVDASWRDIIPFFKIWGDRYPFRAQVKGSSLFIRPVKLVVTSNKTIEELLEVLKWDINDYVPYLRRFSSYYIRSMKEWEDQL